MNNLRHFLYLYNIKNRQNVRNSLLLSHQNVRNRVKLRAKFAPMLAEAYVLHPGDVEEKAWSDLSAIIYGRTVVE